MIPCNGEPQVILWASIVYILRPGTCLSKDGGSKYHSVCFCTADFLVAIFFASEYKFVHIIIGIGIVQVG